MFCRWSASDYILFSCHLLSQTGDICVCCQWIYFYAVLNHQILSNSPVCHLGLAVKTYFLNITYKVAFPSSSFNWAIACAVHFTVAAHFCACVHLILPVITSDCDGQSLITLQRSLAPTCYSTASWEKSHLRSGSNQKLGLRVMVATYSLSMRCSRTCPRWTTLPSVPNPVTVLAGAAHQRCKHIPFCEEKIFAGAHPWGKKKNCIRLQKKTPLAFHEQPLWKDIDHHEQSADTFKTCIIGQTALQVKWGRGWISGWKLMSSLHPPRRLRVRLLFCLLA